MRIDTLRSVFLHIALLAAPLATAAEMALPEGMPQPFSALYEVRAGGFKIGELQRRLVRAGEDTWTFQTDMYTTGLAAVFKPDRYIETSTWTLHAGRLRPLEYVAGYEGNHGSVSERAAFDWEAGTVSQQRRKESSTLPVEPGLLDKLSYQLVLRQDIAAGKERVTYRVADKTKIRDYAFEVVARETLETALGTLETVKMARGETVFWLAPAYDYLVVRLTKEEGGTTLTADILNYKPLAATPVRSADSSPQQ